MDFLDVIQGGESALDRPAARQTGIPFLDVVNDPVTAIAQNKLDEGKSWDETKAALDSVGGDAKLYEGQFKMTEARRRATENPDVLSGQDIKNRLGRVASVLPVVSTVQQIASDESYKDARRKFDQGDYSPEVLDTIARREELDVRKRSQTTSRSVGEEALKVPGMIAEFGLAGKLVKGAAGLAGLGEATSTAGKVAQFAGRSAATGAIVPSMTAAQASSRSVADNSSITDLKNLGPAFVKSAADAAVLGSLQSRSFLSAVPTLVGRSVAKGAVGVGESAAVDTMGSLADEVIGATVKDGKKYQLGSKWGGLVRSAIEGDDEAGKQLLGQMVSFSLFAGAHEAKPRIEAWAESRRSQTGPAQQASLPAPVEALKEFVNTGGTLSEAQKLATRFNELISDPRTAPDAFDIMREEYRERDVSPQGRKFIESVARSVEPEPAVEPGKSPQLGPDGLPPPAKGMVRFYHGGMEGVAGGEKLWFTPDLNDARGWANRGGDMKVQYVDVPADAVPEVMKDDVSGTNMPQYYHRGELPADVAGKRKAIPRQNADTPEWGKPSQTPETAPPEADRPIPAQEPAKSPIAAPGAVSGVPAGKAGLLDRMRQKQAQQGPVAAPLGKRQNVGEMALQEAWALAHERARANETPEQRAEREQREATNDRIAREGEEAYRQEQEAKQKAREAMFPEVTAINKAGKKLERLGTDKLTSLYRETFGKEPPIFSTNKGMALAIAKRQSKSQQQERRAATVDRAPIDQIRDEMRSAGVTDQEAHALTEFLRGRSLKDIGGDEQLAVQRGKNVGLGQSKARVGQLKDAAVAKVGPELVDRLKASFAGKGQAVQAESAAGPVKLTAEQRAERRRERDQDRAGDIFQSLSKESMEQVKANPDKFINKDGTFKAGALESLRSVQADINPSAMQPRSMRRVAVDGLRRAVEAAKENPGPEALQRIVREEQRSRSILEQAGDKQPGRVIGKYVPTLEQVKKDLGQLKELKQRPGESEFSHEERKRSAAGAKTLYQDVLEHVKNNGPLTEGSIGSGEAQVLREGPMARLIGKKGQKGIDAEILARELFAEHGIDPAGKNPVEHLFDLMEQHHLVEEGGWSEKQAAKRDAIEQIQNRGKPEKPVDPWDEPGKSPMLEQRVEDAFGRPLTGAERMMGVVGGGQPDASPMGHTLQETALANARVDQERIKNGLPPLMAAAEKTNPQVWAWAMEKLAADPNISARLVDELAGSSRATTVEENALLLHRKIALSNEYERAMRQAIAKFVGPNKDLAESDRLGARADELLGQIDRLDRVTKSTGTEWGRAGQFRAQLAREDFSLSRMMMEMERAKREPLTPEEKSEIAGLHDKIKSLQDKLDRLKQNGGKEDGDDATDVAVRIDRAKQQYREKVDKEKRRHQTIPAKVIGGTLEAWDAVRTLITAYDLSAVLRQGAFTTFAHPFKAVKALPDMMKSAFDSHHFERTEKLLRERPNADLYKKGDLYLADTLSAPEEAFLGRWVKKLPGVAASERAYTSFLNRLRADVFDSLAASLPRDGKPNLFDARGNPDPTELKAIGNFVNAATGRGTLPGSMERAATGLARIFFSPRYLASRVQVLAGQPFYGGSMRTRGLIAKEYGRAMAGLAAFYAVMLATNDDASVTFDPRSADFGKVRLGNSRVDPLAGLSQVATVATRLVSGQTKNSQTGKVADIRGEKVPFGGQTAGDVILRFLRSKLAPVPGAVVNVLTGEDAVGQPLSASGQAGQLVMPISVRDVYDAMTHEGLPRGSALAMLAILGMGTQFYEPKKKVKK
jgi:hypothetical protein